jgi:hypothetical protein
MTTELATPNDNTAQQQQQQQQYPSYDKEQLAHSNQSTNATVTQSVLADPNIKFPLENSWSFWFYKNEKTKTWKENVKFITTVDFVEDFWGLVLFTLLSRGNFVYFLFLC